jgi:hypothetical protein
MAELGRKKATVSVDMDIAPLESELDYVDKQLTVLDRRVVKPRLDLDVAMFNTKLAAANKQLDAFGLRTAVANIDVNTAGAMAGIAAVTAEIAALRAAAEAPINLNINSSPGAAAASGAVNASAAGSGGGAGLLSAALMGHAGGGGGGRFMPWGLRALGGFGVGAGVGSLGSFAGFGTEHLLLTALGILGSGAAAVGGGALIGAGAAGSMAVGGGSDLAVFKSTAADAKSLGEAYKNLTHAQALYGKGSVQAVRATKELKLQMKELAAGSNGEGVKAEMHLAHEYEKVNEQWDRATQKARVIASRIFERGSELGKHFIPKVAHAANMNLPIVNQGLAPLQNFLEGPEGSKIWATLEHEFKKNLPTALHAFDQAMQFVLKTVAVASHYTGGFVEMLDRLFTKWNSPEGFKSWEGEIHSLVDTFKVWMTFFKTLGSDIFNLFKLDAHTGRGIVEALTEMLKKVGEWEKSTEGRKEIHNLFVVHKEEVLALLRILPPLVSSFKDIYMTVAPPMVEAVTDVLNVVAKLLNVFEKTGPLARWALGITLILAKLRLLVPLLKTVGILSAGDVAAGAAAGTAGAEAAAGGSLAAGGAAAGTVAGVSGFGVAALPEAGMGAALATGGLGAAAGAGIRAAIAPAAAAAGGYFAAEFGAKAIEGITGADLLENQSLWTSITHGFKTGAAEQGDEFMKMIHHRSALIHKANLELKSSWLGGLPELQAALKQELEKIDTLWPGAKNAAGRNEETAKAMAAAIEAIHKGVKAGTITAKEGAEAIKKIYIESLTFTGKDPIGLGKAIADSFKKAGGATEVGVQGMIKKLERLPPKARGETENAILGMMHAWAAGHPKLERQVEGINERFEAVFNRTNRRLIAGAGDLNEALGREFGSLLQNVSLDLSGIGKATEEALSALGVKQSIKISTSFGETHGNFGGLGPNEKHPKHATGARVDSPMFMVGEEAPQHPEWVVASNPAYRNANLGYWAEAGHALGVPGFAQGGIPDPRISGPAMLAAVGNRSISDVHKAAVEYLKKLTPTGGLGAGYVSGGGGAVMAQMFRILAHYGANKIGASGYIGNAGGESGLNPGAVGTGGGGLFGFTAGEISLANLHAFAKRAGKPWTDVGLQMQFMLGHGGMGLIPAMNRQHSPGAAAAYFMNNWEHPGIPRLNVREAYARAAFAKGYKGGGRVATSSSASSEAARAVGFARSNKGSGPKWGNPPGGWCGEFMAADMEAAGLEPPHGFPLAANWASYGEARQVADAGDVVVYGGSGHVGLAVGNGALISGDWGGIVGKSAVRGGGYPGPIVAIRRPPYKDKEGGSTGGGSTTAASTPAQKERQRIAAFEKAHAPGSTGPGGGTFGPGATKHEIASTLLPGLQKSPLPAWAAGLPLHQREELEGRGETTEGRRTTLSFAEALAGRALSKAEGAFTRIRAAAAKNHEYNSVAVEDARRRIKAAKEGQKAAYSAAYGFESGIIKFATKKIKEANRKLGTKLTAGQRKKWLMIKAKYEAIRATARGEKINDKEIIEADELYGAEEALEIAEEKEEGQNYLKEKAEAAAAGITEAMTIYAEDITSLNSARWALLSGNASNILNLGSGGELSPGSLPNLGSDIMTALGPQATGYSPIDFWGKVVNFPNIKLNFPDAAGNESLNSGSTSTVNQYLTINTPEVSPHAVAEQLAWRAKVS